MDWCRDYLGLGRVIPRLSKIDKDSTKPATAANSPLEEHDYLLDHVSIADGSKAMPLSTAILTKTLLAKTIDCPAYANLTTTYCNQVFNPHTPDSQHVQYFSFAASTPANFPIWHPLYLPYQVVSEKEGKSNDGLVSIESAKWGKFIATVPCDHWELRGRGLPGAKFNVDEFYRGISTMLYNEGF
ncbi:lipase 2 [Savitreella phatthalungensis]